MRITYQSSHKLRKKNIFLNLKEYLLLPKSKNLAESIRGICLSYGNLKQPRKKGLLTVFSSSAYISNYLLVLMLVTISFTI
jgi:hypothetical protein